MIGEISLGGVFVPLLLVYSVIALVCTTMFSQLLSLTGAYRFVAYRPLIDLALFVLFLGLLVFVSEPAMAVLK